MANNFKNAVIRNVSADSTLPTEIYKVPKKAGSYKAKKIGSLNTNSIVTGGDYEKHLNLLVLTSTVEFDNYFLIRIDNFDLKSENNQINMYEIPIGKTQVEAVKIIDSHNFCGHFQVIRLLLLDQKLNIL